MVDSLWKTHNPAGKKRVVVTKELPGVRWIEVLSAAGCCVEVCTSSATLSAAEIRAAMDSRCDGVIGQLTETWGAELFAALKAAGGTAYSNYAVGYNNIELDAATRVGIPVGNTPGVLTDTTAEMAVALTFAAVRRVGEAERFLRAGRFHGWLPMLFLGELLAGKTVGIIGAGRIGDAYARMMVEGHKMHVVYFDLHRNAALEQYVADYAVFLQTHGLPRVTCRRAERLEDLLREADVVSIHTVLDDSTRHLINAERLNLMKDNALIVNTSRGPVIDEAALVAHCRRHPNFRAGLDVFENEPKLASGLAELENVVIVPHIASATKWTREGMATLAASNVAGLLMGYPAWNRPDVGPFLGNRPPRAAPSILNAKELSISLYEGK
jgi:hydroxypyruvate reductase 1